MTQPIEEILPRENDQKEVVELLKQFSAIIDEVVNYGTHVLSWEIAEARGGEENIPITMMLRHILELTDSISILVKQSSIDPCKLLLRGILESFLALEYILEKDSIERALSFLVYNYHEDLKYCKKLNPKEQAHKQFLKKYELDKSIPEEFKLPEFNNLENHIANTEKILSFPIYSKSEEEYQRIISEGSRIKNWYQMFSGIRNLSELADYLNRQTLYEILYRGWSGSTHGVDIYKGKLSTSLEGQTEIVQIRYVKDAQSVTQHAVVIALLTFQIITDKRLTNHKMEYSLWYLSFRQSYTFLFGKDLIVI